MTPPLPPSRRVQSTPAISLWQPYASFIAIGVKPYETRHWRAPMRFMGVRVAIHAAKHPVPRTDFQWWQRVAGATAPLPMGAMVCTAVIRSVHWAQDVPSDEYGDYTPGRFCWHLTEIEPIDPPIPAKGAQGFWMWASP